jgi:hypothetical protein
MGESMRPRLETRNPAFIDSPDLLILFLRVLFIWEHMHLALAALMPSSLFFLHWTSLRRGRQLAASMPEVIINGSPDGRIVL